jgi:hypothetical protein
MGRRQGPFEIAIIKQIKPEGRVLKDEKSRAISAGFLLCIYDFLPEPISQRPIDPLRVSNQQVLLP